MCECAYCGHKLTRHTRHSNSTYEKPVWQCMNATKHGIKNCPNCKAIDEVILEGAFVEAFGLLAGNFEDVLEIVLAAVESSLILDEFDRVIFESIIDRVLVGGYNEDGSPDPYKLTFVLKGNQTGVVPNAKAQYKAKNSEKGKMVS